MFVKPTVYLQQAAKIFSAKKSSVSIISRMFPGKNPASPEKLEIVYLPFYLFEVAVERTVKGKKTRDSYRQDVTLSVDGLLGHAVLFAGQALEIEKSPETPAPVCDFIISSSDAAMMALDQYKGILLEHGLRTRSYSHAKEISEGRKIYYPFWIAYFKKKKSYDFKAVDAVSGEIQGIRMRRVFIRALKSLS